MTDGIRRRGRRAAILLRAGLISLIVLPSLTAFAVPAQASTAKETCRHSLVGTWQASVETSLPSAGETTFVFRADGTIEPPPGEPVTDTWQAISCNYFVFDIVHPNLNGQGEVIGEVRGHQDGLLVRNHFVSRGTSVIYDLDDQVIRSFEVQVRAVRVIT
ncbi:hypothetical protein [Micromonospora sp. LOL_023]|uniref:hypothetical protein n=1 Tax=Micromonospora sp. LOL_023 TaxID=3345418 RepID=UPI003A8C4874